MMAFIPTPFFDEISENESERRKVEGGKNNSWRWQAEMFKE
jgi:hypothetical protein